MSRDAPTLAVLIDSDNAQAAVISDLLAEVAQVGTATVKRAYGDWTTPQLGSWKDVLNVHAIVPVQQFSYTSGKNATDSALIIDAMDLLHGGRVDGFCLVSSDSDFTRLATRIREQGLLVIGFGERKTPKAFVAACDRFLYTDLLKRDTGRAGSGGGGAGHDHDGAPPLKPFLSEAITAVTQAFARGWIGEAGVKRGSFTRSAGPGATGRRDRGPQAYRCRRGAQVPLAPDRDAPSSSHRTPPSFPDWHPLLGVLTRGAPFGGPGSP